MPQPIKSTPVFSLKLMPMFLLVQWVGLMGSISVLNAAKGWAAEETVDASVVSEASSGEKSRELSSSAATSEAAPSSTATEKSSSTVESQKPTASAVSKQTSPTATETSRSTADQEIKSAVVSEPAVSPAEVTENQDSSTTESQVTPMASEEATVQPVSVSTEKASTAATGKLLGSSATTTEDFVESPTGTFEPEAATQTISQAIPDTTASTPEATAQPSISTAEETEIAAPEVAPAPTSVPAPVKKPVTSRTNSTDSGEAYIDRTNYSVGATQPRRNVADRPSVVLSERSTGCRAVLSAGQGVAGNLCGSIKNQALKGITANASGATLTQSATTKLIKVGAFLGGVTSTQTLAKSGLTRSIVSSIPLNRNSIGSNPRGGLGSFTSSLSNYRNIKISKWFVPSNTRIIFPLAIPVAITSAFGWRLHPISGTWRFHSGTDLGAPMGTPVLAASAGKVAIANFLGGYGLAVVLDHNKGTQESLYGHLSEVMVKPGAWVKQGDVIGLVGSTGNSTGPHLHFEVRQSTPQGWVAVDPGQQLETALAQLVQALQTAQASNPRPGT